MGLYKRKITADDKLITSGVGLTLKQSLGPCALGEGYHPDFTRSY